MVGNSLVITVVRKTRSMRTTTNFLLVNLAAADIVTLLFNPVLQALVWPKSFNSDFMCKFFTGNGFIGVPFLVSVFTLVVIAVERYHALLKPMATGLRLSKENVHYAIAVTWIFSIALNIPIVIDYRSGEEEAGKICKGVWRMDMSGKMAKYILFYSTLALSSNFLVIYCYLQIFRGIYITNMVCPEQSMSAEDRKAKKELARVLVSVSGLFFVTQTPLNVFLLYVAAKGGVRLETIYFPLHIVAFLAFLNSCINPIVYAFRSENYKTAFKKILRCQPTGNADASYPS